MRANNLRRAACLFAAMGCMQAQASGERDLGRETLHPEVGWAANATGVIGGAGAVPEQVYVVTNHSELIAALNHGVVSSTSPATPSNAVNHPDLAYDAGWTPVLNHQLLPVWTAPILVPLFTRPKP